MSRSDDVPRSEMLQVWKAEFFKALSHPARIQILEYLRTGEHAAGEIMAALGLEQSNGSQHLSVLRGKDIVVARRQGSTVYYSVRDPMIFEVLDLLRQYFYDHLTGIRDMLEAMEPAATEGRGSTK